MIAGRVIVGAAIGLLSACVPMYLAEGECVAVDTIVLIV